MTTQKERRKIFIAGFGDENRAGDSSVILLSWRLALLIIVTRDFETRLVADFEFFA